MTLIANVVCMRCIGVAVSHLWKTVRSIAPLVAWLSTCPPSFASAMAASASESAQAVETDSPPLVVAYDPDDVPLTSIAMVPDPKPVAGAKIKQGANFEAVVEKANRLRVAVIKAVCDRSFDKLSGLAGSLQRLPVSTILLQRTGVGHLVNDKSLWALAGEGTAKTMAESAELWKKSLHRTRSSAAAMEGTKAEDPPFGGLKCGDFLAALNALKEELPTYLDGPSDQELLHQLAVNLALHGFRSAKHLRGVTPEELAVMVKGPGQRSLVDRVLVAVEARYAVQRKRVATALSAAGSDSSQPTGPVAKAKRVETAQALGDRLQNMDVDQVHQVIEKAFKGYNVPLGDNSLPASSIRALGEAHKQGAPVGELLAAKAATLRLETKRRSLPQVASALRCWHAFATAVLSYENGDTLPPKHSSDVEAFVAIFKNGNTAANYVGFIRWACTHLHLSLSWDTATLSATVKGARKRHERVFGGTKHAAQLLTEETLAKVVRTADRVQRPDVSVFCLVAWEFLLRVQSEAVPLCTGSPSYLNGLPPDTHSGVWVDNDGTLCLKLARRKNRPNGSTLRRPCTCGTRGRQLCVVHRTQAWLASRQVAQPLWSFTPDTALKALRRMLTLSGVPVADQFTLKAFRAGKATALAVQGKSLGTILQAGEWRSSAFLSYVDTDTVDQAQLLEQTLALSDDEAQANPA